ncbi:MAG: hypothetical protein M0Z63_04915 [Actinomycetota bacterium]|jgi:hypothetical protein|nr:hypothetical protein [Actinomycetota bacterium]
MAMADQVVGGAWSRGASTPGEGRVGRRQFLSGAGRGAAFLALAGSFGGVLDACSGGTGLGGPFTVSFDSSGSFQGTIGGQQLSGSASAAGSYGGPYTLTGTLGGASFALTVNQDSSGMTASGTWGTQNVRGTVQPAQNANQNATVHGTVGGSSVSAVVSPSGLSQGTASGTVL